jgi:2,4-dienoyl-CoA reductase-like NADH-dependent reductase (Old Yellow Enzyme family)
MDIRSKVGEEYPVLIKIGVQDGFSGGLEFHEGGEASRYLSQWGYDALEVSSGLRGAGYATSEFRTHVDRLDREAYFRDWCREIRRHVSSPIMMVGGLRTFQLLEEVIRNGEADFVSLCRPLIREPAIVRSWQGNDRRRATCTSCNRCFEALLKGEGLHCVRKKRKH